MATLRIDNDALMEIEDWLQAVGIFYEVLDMEE